MKPTILPFGTLSDGRSTHLYLLSNSSGMSVTITEVGASVVSVRVPDAQGNLLDAALGHVGAQGYERADSMMGATVGRVANRIAGAQFELDGRVYHLAKNEGENNNHSGPDLWCTRIWHVVEASDAHIVLSLLSTDGDQGFPGEVEMRTTYRLTQECQLIITHEGTPSSRTLMNPTNHTYWNLDGHASGSVLEHTLSVDASAYLPTETNVPTGEIKEVSQTCFDLRQPVVLQTVLGDLPRGIDHCYCLDSGDELAHAARLQGGRSGIVLDVLTDAPGIQVYMAGWLDMPVAKDGACYGKFAGVALETQRWPDSVHHPDWPSVIFGPDRPFAQTTVFAFSVA